MIHEIYLKLPTPEGLSPCPCCGAQAELYQVRFEKGGPASKHVCCSRDGYLIRTDDLDSVYCPLSLPSDSHSRATVREAVALWNELADVLTTLRTAPGIQVTTGDSNVAQWTDAQKQECREAFQQAFGDL